MSAGDVCSPTCFIRIQKTEYDSYNILNSEFCWHGLRNTVTVRVNVAGIVVASHWPRATRHSPPATSHQTMRKLSLTYVM